MTYRNAVTYVHSLLQRTVQQGDVVVDATVGNGFDTAALAQLVGPSGHVYGFDIQAQALTAARIRLAESGEHVTLLHAGHEDLLHHVPATVHGSVRAVTFNLGYLPGGDKSRTTTVPTTTAGVAAALQMVAPGGIITVVCYPHPEGQAEYEALRAMLATLRQEEWTCTDVGFVNHPTASARVLCIVRHGNQQQ